MTSSAALSIRNLEIRDSRDLKLVSNLSIEVEPQEIVCLKGHSGAGKTITALAVMGLLPSSLCISTGEIRLGGHLVLPDNNDTIGRLRGRTVSMVFQEPGTSFNHLRSIGDQVGDVLRVHKSELSFKGRCRRVKKAFAEIGFTDVERIYRSFAHELSGGQLQRCMLASTLLTDIKLLIADEPTSSLDNRSCDEVLNVIIQLNQERGMAVLMITHDLKIANRMAHRILTLTEEGLSNSISSPTPHFGLDHRRSSVTALNERSKKKRNLQTAVVRVKRLTKIFQQPVLSLFNRKNISVYALRELSLELQNSEILGITGPSGCGKTTLARCLVGLITWDEGTIEINGHAVHPVVRPQRSADLGIQMIWQHPFASLNPVMQVEEIISENIRKRGTRDKAEIDVRITTALEQVELSKKLRKQRPSELSGGQCQRVVMASILALNPNILVADEPVSYLDYRTKTNMLNLLRKLRDELGLSIIFMSHDLEAVHRISDCIIELDQRRELDV